MQLATTDTSLVGLWAAKKRFGRDLRGRLVIDRPAGDWRAEIAGRRASVRAAGDTLSFALPGGAFTGHFDRGGAALVGHWIQPPMVTSGNAFASPLILTSCGASCFSGNVVPIDDEFTFYLRVAKRPDGTLAAFIRNPERNLGRFIRAERIAEDHGTVHLLGAAGTPVLGGVRRGEVITLFLDDRGGSYDFRRVPADIPTMRWCG